MTGILDENNFYRHDIRCLQEEAKITIKYCILWKCLIESGIVENDNNRAGQVMSRKRGQPLHWHCLVSKLGLTDVNGGSVLWNNSRQ